MNWQMYPGNGQMVAAMPQSVRTIVMPHVPIQVRTAMEYVALHDAITSVHGTDGRSA